MKKRLLISTILILVSVASLPAQDISTQGKEFWLSYMHNGFKDHYEGDGTVTTQVLISAKRACSGIISNLNGTWQQTFMVQANNITTIEIPYEYCYHDNNNYEQISDKGIKVTATDTISVYTTNIAHVSFDASFVLPTESLGDDYIIQTYDQAKGSLFLSSYVTNNLTSAFLIVATEDNTEIDITPTVATLGNKPAGETFTITLNAGQTYHVRSNRNTSNRDLSGTRVTAHDCKKIAVFNGNTLTSIPENMDNGFDHVYEQAMPLRSWGKNFVVTSSTDRNRDYIKITSAYDNNVITKNGALLCTLQANESYTFSFLNEDQSCFISATQACAVYLYHESFNITRYGDPSMVWIAPIEQRIDELNFTTFNDELIDIEKHFINIIVKTEDISEVYLDGQQLLESLFQTVNGNTEYSFTSMEIEHNVHHLRCDNGFNAHVYGFGEAKGYAYMVGSNATDLNTELLINEEEVKPNETYHSCSSKNIKFFAQVNYQDYDLLWDFGDGQTSRENPVYHSYSSAQVYPARLFITTEQTGCSSTESDTIYFFINISPEYINILDTLACLPFHYCGVTYDQEGHYEIQATTAQGCDSILDLNLIEQHKANVSNIIPADTCLAHWVIPATEYQINSYTFNLYNNENDCEIDSIGWTISNCHWPIYISEDQKSCEVFAIDLVSDTIWLNATIYSDCCDTVPLTRKHWLLCSFYDVEEQTSVKPDFNVIPNPNNGQMTLNFESLTGKINVKVYDMNGNLVDSFSTTNGEGTSAALNAQFSMNYEMKYQSPGIYFFVVNGREGTISKRIILCK